MVETLALQLQSNDSRVDRSSLVSLKSNTCVYNDSLDVHISENTNTCLWGKVIGSVLLSKGVVNRTG